MSFHKTTENDSLYGALEKMSIYELLYNINKEDEKISKIVKKEIPKISIVVSIVEKQLNNGGRLFYIGAGTSGRLGILDASECPPTFGVGSNLVIGIIAGGDSAIRNAVEFAEDNENQGWKDLIAHGVSTSDFVIGIAASGTTPYVVGALKYCKENNIPTGCISCNMNSPLAKYSDHPIEVEVGPEFVTGSTRMKAGTAQKLILNMISTSVMIRLGHIKGNKMVDMKLSNNKLLERAIKIIMTEKKVMRHEAVGLLKKYKSVRYALREDLK